MDLARLVAQPKSITAKNAKNTKRSLSSSAFYAFFAVIDFGCGVSRGVLICGFRSLV